MLTKYACRSAKVYTNNTVCMAYRIEQYIGRNAGLNRWHFKVPATLASKSTKSRRRLFVDFDASVDGTLQ